MPAGRPSKSKRCPFGERLLTARERKGLSQQQVAEAIGVVQQTYASWERRDVAIKPESIVRLARILDTTADELLGFDKKPSKASGPTGKLRRLLDEVGALPRYQQQRVLATLEDALVAQRAKRAS